MTHCWRPSAPQVLERTTCKRPNLQTDGLHMADMRAGSRVASKHCVGLGASGNGQWLSKGGQGGPTQRSSCIVALHGRGIPWRELHQTNSRSADVRAQSGAGIGGRDFGIRSRRSGSWVPPHESPRHRPRTAGWPSLTQERWRPRCARTPGHVACCNQHLASHGQRFGHQRA